MTFRQWLLDLLAAFFEWWQSGRRTNLGGPVSDFVPCTLRQLPDNLTVAAAAEAIAANPANRCLAENLLRVMTFAITPGHIAVLTTKYWGSAGVKLGVTFLDTKDPSLKQRILAHMNAWNQSSNVQFAESSQGEVRIARTPRDGYWSFLGTDIRLIAPGEPTMNLDSFSMSTPESEYKRVVRHETGHTLGFPHEHMRRELVARLDPEKTLAYFGRTQGWSADQVRAQVLTPLDEAALKATLHADQMSIMTYSLPGSITIDGQPIIGGVDIDPSDFDFASLIYPKPVAPPPQPPPVEGRVFGLSFQRAVGKGQQFGPIRAPVRIEAGEYDVVRKS